jgi:hypothetical protein
LAKTAFCTFERNQSGALRALNEFGRSARLKTQILIVCFSLCICFGSLFAISQTSSFQFLQKPGPYSVGLNVVDQYDPTRAYLASSKQLSKSSVGDDARPLQTLIWYPSVRSAAKSMTVGDYVELADTFNAPDEKSNPWRSLLKTSFDVPLWSVRNATPKKWAFSRPDLCSQRFFRFLGERRSVRVFFESWICCSRKPVDGRFDARNDG